MNQRELIKQLERYEDEKKSTLEKLMPIFSEIAKGLLFAIGMGMLAFAAYMVLL